MHFLAKYLRIFCPNFYYADVHLNGVSLARKELQVAKQMAEFQQAANRKKMMRILEDEEGRHDFRTSGVWSRVQGTTPLEALPPKLLTRRARAGARRHLRGGLWGSVVPPPPGRRAAAWPLLERGTFSAWPASAFSTVRGRPFSVKENCGVGAEVGDMRGLIGSGGAASRAPGPNHGRFGERDGMGAHVHIFSQFITQTLIRR